MNYLLAHLDVTMICYLWYTLIMKYKAILFDMDGVIFDNESLHMAAFRTTLSQYGHGLDNGQYMRYFAGKTDEEGFKQYFDIINEEVNIPTIMREKTKAYLDFASNQPTPYPDMIPLIKELSNLSELAIVTGSSRTEVDSMLRVCGLENQFSVIISADDVAHSKPNSEGYLKAADSLNVSVDKCVVVEDSPSGVQAAFAAKIDCIAVTNTHSLQELKLATQVVDTLSIDLF